MVRSGPRRCRPAGLAAAIYAARAGLAPVVIAPPGGGQLLGKGVTVENFPGVNGVTGPGVVELMRAHARSFGVLFEESAVLAVALGRRPFALRTGDANASQELEAHALVVATGADSVWLGVEGEARFRGGGVSSCATCDGFLFRDKPVAVVGGGDTAMEDALVLARTSSRVTVLVRRDRLRASHALAQRVLAHASIDVRWNTTVAAFDGASERVDRGGGVVDELPTLTSVRLRDAASGADAGALDVAACFVAIGHTPNTGLFKGQLDMDETGYLATRGKSTETSVPGVFAAGDVADRVYRQAITSAGSGAAAALDAERWLSEHADELGGGDGADLLAELIADEAAKRDGVANAYDDADVLRWANAKVEVEVTGAGGAASA